MKPKILIAALLFSLFVTSCVQKTFKKTVVFILDVSEIKDIKKVGIRGNDKPLSWDYDTQMKEVKKDRLFKITLTGETGYKFTEVKFVINDKFEFENENNRRVIFFEKDTTLYRAKFNKR